MDTDIKNKVTRTEMRAVTDLVEDICSEPGCEMSILVSKSVREQGRKSRCVACEMRAKIARGEVR